MKEEVLVPGGSLDHALWALEGGADAVYVGYEKFSARSHAGNLSLEDISGLTAVAAAKGAKVFCAVNTILGPEEIAQVVGLAWELHFRGVHALIVQDLGLTLALRRHGPPIALHASTQTAVHNPGGVAALKAMGFSRVVLARELTMTEIRDIVTADPEMEYEVFVHGALCYAVSGNCMASGMMIGRSANRGDCGQVCRTKFELDYLIPGPRRRESPHEEGLPEGIHAPPGEITWKQGTIGAFASMNDLELGSRIRELRDVGVRSFKIEGRMKPPAYSFNTARAYKAFLAGGRDAEAWSWLDEARVRYGRLPSTGWFDGHKALAQTNPGWAGTLGLPLGIISSGKDKTLKIPTQSRLAVFRSLSKGDGIMVIGTDPGDVHRAALAGPAVIIGNHAELPLAEGLKFEPKEGTLWLLSRHDGKLPVKKPGRPWRHPIDMALSFSEPLTSSEGIDLTISITTSALDGPSLSQTFKTELSRSEKSLSEVLKETFQASDSPFHPGKLTFQNPPGNLFISPRLIKEFRRQWYALVEDRAKDFIKKIPEKVIASATALDNQRSKVRASEPPRKELSPLQGVNGLIGFITEWDNLQIDQLAATQWGFSLPLAPFTPDEESYFARLRDFLLRIQAQDKGIRFFPGLNNPCHITWIGKLREEGFPLENWFADWGFHKANTWTSAGLDQALPGMVFAIHWLEDPNSGDHSYFPPLFTSRACMLRNSFAPQEGHPSMTPTAAAQSFDSRQWTQAKAGGLALTRPAQGPHCPDGCAGHFSARLLQGKTHFRVEARDCINYLIMEK